MIEISPSGKCSVLLIDDDDMVAGALRQYLAMREFDVDTAPDFPAAETLMASRAYRVIVVDPYLTGGVQREGSAVIEAICRRQPGASVIVLTGYDSAALAQIAADCHVAALLTKPQSIVALGRIISAAGSLNARPPAPSAQSASTKDHT